MSLQEMIEEIFGYEFEKDEYSLDNIKQFLNILNNPQDQFKSIHIGGTNGKGSTSYILSELLQTNNNKVGLFTSPHFYKYNERFRINSNSIDDNTLEELIIKLKQVAKINNINLTFFEFTTAIAFQYFKEEKVDYAVVEVGCGGKLDATNVISPIISAITNVSIDHTNILGKTEQEIAEKKAGIIKPNTLFATSNKNETINNIFKQIAKENYHNTKDIIKIKSNGLAKFNNKYMQKVTINNDEYFFSLLGNHQIQNLELALSILKLINCSSIDLNKLKNIKWQGRLEIFEEDDKLIIFDGCHNEVGFQNIKKELEEIFANPFFSNYKGKKLLVFGLSKGKEVSPLRRFLEKFDEIHLSEGDKKPMSIGVLRDEIKKLNIAAKVFANNNSEHQFKEIKNSMVESDIMVIVGSLYLVPKYRKFFNN